jgi:hypothetical protein
MSITEFDNVLDVSEFNSPVTELDTVTGKVTTREMTEDELVFQDKLQEEHKLIKEQQEQVEVDKMSAVNKLAALGLTEAEVSALLGL